MTDEKIESNKNVNKNHEQLKKSFECDTCGSLLGGVVGAATATELLCMEGLQ